MQDRRTVDRLIALGMELLQKPGDQVVIHGDGCGAGADGKIDWKLPCTCAPRVLTVSARAAA